MVRIVIADDHDATRHSLRSALSQDGSWEICAEACNGREALQQVIDLHPDLVILDYLMPQMNGLEAACEIRIKAPSTKIVVLSMIDTPQMEGATQLVGVDAFIPKSSGASDLIAILKQVLDPKEDSPLRRLRRL